MSSLYSQAPGIRAEFLAGAAMCISSHLSSWPLAFLLCRGHGGPERGLTQGHLTRKEQCQIPTHMPQFYNLGALVVIVPQIQRNCKARDRGPKGRSPRGRSQKPMSNDIPRAPCYRTQPPLNSGPLWDYLSLPLVPSYVVFQPKPQSHPLGRTTCSIQMG